jgi:hypothetical protein
VRGVADAFHLELRYNDLANELDLRVTITGDTATRADRLRARGGARTRTPVEGSRF